jgi:predicted DNA-binding transcriptional regulator YafY
MPRSSRLLLLIQALRRYRTPVTARQLADELGISERSIYRDVATLREQGATIEGEAGVGYVLRPGFVLPPLMFTDDELEALVLGLRLTAEHADPGLGRAAADVLSKVRAVLPRDLRRVVDESALFAGPHRHGPEIAIDLAAVRRSIRDARKVRIAYADERGQASERVIWPIGLAFFERARLVVGWCEKREDFRSFRADRISRWEPLTAGFDRPRRALLADWRAREGIAAPIPAAPESDASSR